MKDLDDDHAVLEELRNRIADIGAEDGGKLARLREFLEGADGEKVLVFSEAETTVDYLFGQLNPDGGNDAIAKLSGSNRDRLAGIVSRFGPQANLTGRGQPPEREIRLLIATGVVSESQNMQDCARVLNYDLHWNPVRLIQRFGRVDRIGSPHDEIHLHNMLPDAQPDEGLGLTGKLSGRIQAFHDLKGSEAGDAPQSGETVVMLAASDAVRCYAVGDGLTPRPIRTAQFAAAAECEPDTPTRPLPENTNARVSAAAEAFGNDLSRMLGLARRRTPGNARNRSFVRRQLNGVGADIAAPQRIETLRQAFAGDLPAVVENELPDLRRLNLGYREVVQERYCLNPAEQGAINAATEPARIVCSDGLS